MRPDARSWSMYPKLHSNVQELLDSDGLSYTFHKKDDPKGCTRDYDTTIMGRFACRNPSCSSKGWSSKLIAITIRLYDDSRYNARVYHQRCQSCDTVSRPWLDNSYAERIVYRLKSWRGIKQPRAVFSGGNNRPHRTALCEGCRHGHCEWSPGAT